MVIGDSVFMQAYDKGFKKWEDMQVFIKAQPPALRAGYMLDQYIAQVNNGGVNQYLFNTRMTNTDELLAAMKLVGANEHHAVFAAFMEEADTLKTKHNQAHEHTDWQDYAETFLDSYGDEGVQQLEDKMNAIHPELAAIAAEYFVANLHLFESES